jgi:hypothetical protein
MEVVRLEKEYIVLSKPIKSFNEQIQMGKKNIHATLKLKN